MSHSGQERRNFTFRYQPYANTPDSILIDHLQTGDAVRSGKEMVLLAIRAFWLPLAYYEAGNFSEEEIRRIGLMCCHALEHQITYIRLLLQLPASSTTVQTFPSVPHSPQGVETMNYAGNSNGKDKSNTDDLLPGKGSFSDTNDLFGNI
jgi:hypothetical protein